MDKAVEKMLPNKAEPRRGGLSVNLAKYSPILIFSVFTYIYLSFTDSLLSDYRFMLTVLYRCRKTVNNALVAIRNMVKKSIAQNYLFRWQHGPRQPLQSGLLPALNGRDAPLSILFGS